MERMSTLTAELSASVDDFVHGKGQFRGNRTTKGARKLYRKKGSIPMPYLEWLEKQGFKGVIEVFANCSRTNRTVPVLLSYLDSRADARNRVTRILAEGQMLGNFRYCENDSRASPQTILNGMVDRLQ